MEFSWLSWSVSQAHREPEAPARWEGGDVDVTPDRLGFEGVHLGVHSGVVGMSPQIATAEAQLRRPHTASKSRNYRLGHVEGKRQLTQLHERSILDINPRLLREKPESICPLFGLNSPVCFRVGVIGLVRAEIVKELGEIDDAPAVLPVQ